MSQARYALPPLQASISDLQFVSNLISQEAFALSAVQASGTALEALSIDRPYLQLFKKLNGLVDNVRGMVQDKMQALVPKLELVDLSDLVKETKARNYLDLTHLKVPVPTGMACTWLEYLAVLQECTDVSVAMYENVLYPFELFIGQALNNPSIIGNSSFQHSVRAQDLTPLKKQIASVKRNGEETTLPYGRAVKRNGDWYEIQMEAKRLLKTQEKLPADLVKRSVDNIDSMLKKLLAVMADPNKAYRTSPEVVSQMADLCSLMAEQVSFYSATIALNSAAITALEQTPDSLKTVLKA